MRCSPAAIWESWRKSSIMAIYEEEKVSSIIRGEKYVWLGQVGGTHHGKTAIL